MKFLILIIIMLYMDVCYAAKTANIEFKATIEKGCLFQASSILLDFGEYPTTSRQTNVTASIVNSASSWNIKCTPNTPVSIVFGNGQNFLSSSQTRRLKSEVGNYYIDYSIYKDSGRSQLIGTGASTNKLELSSTISNSMLIFGVYGAIDLSLGEVNKSPGRYSDEILITISW
jgi:spore coat protein U-like protein